MGLRRGGGGDSLTLSVTPASTSLSVRAVPRASEPNTTASRTPSSLRAHARFLGEAPLQVVTIDIARGTIEDQPDDVTAPVRLMALWPRVGPRRA
jgi:hypothetical protein